MYRIDYYFVAEDKTRSRIWNWLISLVVCALNGLSNIGRKKKTTSPSKGEKFHTIYFRFYHDLEKVQTKRWIITLLLIYLHTLIDYSINLLSSCLCSLHSICTISMVFFFFGSLSALWKPFWVINAGKTLKYFT